MKLSWSQCMQIGYVLWVYPGDEAAVFCGSQIVITSLIYFFPLFINIYFESVKNKVLHNGHNQWFAF